MDSTLVPLRPRPFPTPENLGLPRASGGPPIPLSPPQKNSTSGSRVLQNEALREAYEERAAIMEYDGGLSREEAEREARRLTCYDGW